MAEYTITGTSNGIVLNNDSMYVINGATANKTTVNQGGYMYISSGGTAAEIKENGGYVYFEEGANVTFAANTVSGASLNFENMTVHFRTVANNTTLDYWSNLYVFSGGITNTTTVNDSLMCVYSGGTANKTTVKSSGTLHVSNGAKADSTTVNAGGNLFISSGGIATNVVWTPCVGHVYAAAGAEVSYTSSYSGVYLGSDNVLNSHAQTMDNKTVSGTMYVMNGGKVNNTTVDDWGTMYVSSGASASNTAVKDGGMEIHNGGVADKTTVTWGKMSIYSEGVASNTVLNSEGGLFLESGGKHKGSLQISSTGYVSASVGAVIDFTVSGRKTTDDYLINNLSLISGTPTYTITVSASQENGTYKLAKGASAFTGSITVGNGNTILGSVSVNGSPLTSNGKTYSLLLTNDMLTLNVSTPNTGKLQNLRSSNTGVSWEYTADCQKYVVEYSKNNFNNVIRIETSTTVVDTYSMPTGTYQWHVSVDNGNWVAGNNITSTNTASPQKLVSDNDGNMDVFFARKSGVWSSDYSAQHHGVVNVWSGTAECVTLEGKNVIADVFSGSADANILLLTDDANGDALFVDDFYTQFGKDAARISQIDEIRAGAGDDIIDMTSQQFAYTGTGVKIYGGLGNDTIWSNSGNNTLFGDAGNDRIIGAANNDVIVGGSGNDSMHGGGGNDIFCFGNNWGVDTIEQLPGGEVTLWFESGSADNWNSDTLTYTDGKNSVTVTGVTDVTIKFGDTDILTTGAFFDFASEMIFEDKNKGLLA